MLRQFAVYTLALAALAAAVAARWYLDPALGDSLPLTLTYGAVTFAVWFGGWHAATVVAVLGFIAGSYLFIEPRGNVSLDDPRHLVALVAYAVICGILIALGEAIRSFRRRSQQAEAELRMALSASRVIAWSYDFRTGQVTTSANAAAVVGLPERLSAQAATQAVHPDDLQPLTDTVGRAIDQRQDYLHDFRIIRPGDGQTVWLQTRGKLECDARGQPLRLVGTAADVTERKEADQVSLRERELLQTIIDRIPVMIVVYDPLSKLLRLNPEFERVVGWTARDTAGVSLMEQCYPDPSYRQRVAEFMESCRDGWMDIHMRTRDGREIETSWANIRLSSRMQVGIGIEITDRKRVEQSLARRVREQAALYEFTDRLQRAGSLQEIYDSALNAIVGALACSRASIQLFDDTALMRFVAWRGLSEAYRNDVEGHSPWIWGERNPRPIGVPDIHVADVPEPFKTVVRAEGISALGFIPLVENDQLIGKFMVYYDLPHVYTDEEMELALTIARQLAFAIERNRAEARRREAEQALRRSEERYRAVVDGQADMLCRFRPDGTILFVNPAYALTRATRPENLIGKNFWEFITLEDQPGVRALLDRLTPQTPEVRIENRFSTADGERWTLWTNRALGFDPDGRWTEAQSAGIDITERKRAEEALKDADRRKDEFLATLAHELRNPLAPLLNSLELIKRSKADPKFTESATEVMQRQLRHMVRLVDDLLDVSRISRNRLELRLQRVDLVSVVDQAVEAVRPISEQSRHELKIDLPPQPIHFKADPVRLAQVLGNLLNNACKYTPPGGRIELSARQEQQELRIVIRDNGVGIPSAMLGQVFDLFTQVDRSMEKEQGGLGIGLSLVKRLVEMHGGSVEARSQGEGQGSEFIVTLPALIDESAPAATAPPATAPRASQPRRILVVDDNRDAAQGLARLLQFTGHQTDIALDGAQAVERAAAFDPQVVLMDIGLPKLNGFDACRAIRLHPGGAQRLIVAITGWGQEEDRRRTREAGFDAHLVKPVNLDTLNELLGTLDLSPDPLTPAAAS